MHRRIGTRSALLFGMVAFGSAQATACDCCGGYGSYGGYGYGGYGSYGGYGYYDAPAPAYYATPAPAYYATPAPAYYAAPAPAYYAAPGPAYYAAPAPAYYAAPGPAYYAAPPAYYAAPTPAYNAPAPAYYADPGYAANAPPPVSRPSARYYAAAGKWNQSASMLGGPRKNIIPVANPTSQGGKATVASHSGAQNKALAAGKNTLAISAPTAKNGRLAKPQSQQALASGGMSMSSPSRYGKPGVRHMAADLRGE
jgi:hypothetical protein